MKHANQIDISPNLWYNVFIFFSDYINVHQIAQAQAHPKTDAAMHRIIDTAFAVCKCAVWCFCFLEKPRQTGIVPPFGCDSCFFVGKNHAKNGKLSFMPSTLTKSENGLWSSDLSGVSGCSRFFAEKTYAPKEAKGEKNMNNYTIETLMPLNITYHMKHGIKQSDVDMANKYRAIIEASRTDNQIQPGDMVEMTTKHGDYYQNAHIESRDKETGRWSVCEQPYIPFINLTDTEDNITCSTSGGAWSGVDNNLKLLGKRVKYFKDWGYNGCRASGAVTFEAEVNVWEYKHPESLYREYSTKDYDKQYITYCVDESGNPKDGSPYRYIGKSIAFINKEEYTTWLKTFRGVEFKGNWPNQTVVFLYKRIQKLVSKEEYDALPLLTDTRWCNGTIEVKVHYDDSARTITEYRWTNSGRDLAEKGVKPYRLWRGTT